MLFPNQYAQMYIHYGITCIISCELKTLLTNYVLFRNQKAVYTLY